MPELLNSSGLIVRIDDATPTIGGETASWLGSSVASPQAAPALRGAVVNQYGTGRFPIGTRVSGRRGTFLVSVNMSAAGTARTIGYLTDNPADPSNRLTLGIDTSNRPLISFTSNRGTVVALVAPSYAAITTGTPVSIHVAWDSSQALDGTRFAFMRVRGEAIPSANWSTDPTSAWSSFMPTHLVLGVGVGGASAFNGTINSFQISDTVVT